VGAQFPVLLLRASIREGRPSAPKRFQGAARKTHLHFIGSPLPGSGGDERLSVQLAGPKQASVLQNANTKRPADHRPAPIGFVRSNMTAIG
jgi:hypothetical protein